jgi:uncharacterized membrane-anchored protein
MKSWGTNERHGALVALAVMALVLSLTAAHAQTGAAGTNSQAEIETAVRAAAAAKIVGPAEVRLGDQAVLRLPQGHSFVPAREAAALLHAAGNRTGPSLLGLVVSETDPGANWFAVMNFIASGYIKDDDAKEWNADDLLAGIREGTEDANRERKARGIPELDILGWVERPLYDAATHRLVWSLSSRTRGEPDAADKGVNYNTYALGREGHMSLNLVTSLAAVEKDKAIARTLLGAIVFNDGKRYQDFDAATDRVAEFGLAALIAGVAAKKLGMFALVAAFVVKFWKMLAIAALAFGGSLIKVLRRNSAS